MSKSKQELKQSVLDELKMHGSKTRAAKRTGVNRSTINRWISSDPVFGAAAVTAVTLAKY